LDDSYNTEITAVLLGFCMLDKAQRHVFAEQFNNFVYGSSYEQQRLMQIWSAECRESENPTVRMIAESSAVYTVGKKRRRKARRRK
jgi:hypothetical protein